MGKCLSFVECTTIYSEFLLKSGAFWIFSSLKCSSWLAVTKLANSASDHWSLYCNMGGLCLVLWGVFVLVWGFFFGFVVFYFAFFVCFFNYFAPWCFAFSRIPRVRAGCCAMEIRALSALTSPRCCPHCQQGTVWGQWLWRRSSPSLAGLHIPEGAAASPPSFLSPLLVTVLSLFHISSATLNFACSSEALWSRLTLHVHFWIWKICKFDSILISLIISLFTGACALMPYFFRVSGMPLCCVLLAADVSKLWGVAISIPSAAVTKHRFLTILWSFLSW